MKLDLNKIMIFLLSIYIFISGVSVLINQFNLFSSVLLGFIVILVYKKVNYTDEKYFIILIVIILLFNVISLTYTANFSEGIRFIFILIFAVIFGTVIRGFKDIKFLVRLFLMFAGIHTFFVLVQIVAPDIVTTINRIILADIVFEKYMLFLKYNYYTGLTGSNHMSAFFISIIIGYVFVYLVNSMLTAKSEVFIKILHFIVLVLSFIALAATQKRGLLLANFSAMIFVVLLFLFRIKKHRFKIAFFVSSIFFIGYSLVSTNPQVQSLYSRFFVDNNFLTGRETIYESVFDSFMEHPIFGNGVGSTLSIIDISAHNIYLQLLNDYGVFGTVFFLLLFGMILLKALKVLYILVSMKSKYTVYVLFSIYIQVIFLVYGLSGNPLYDNFILFSYVLIAAIPFSINKYLNIKSNTGGQDEKSSWNNQLS